MRGDCMPATRLDCPSNWNYESALISRLGTCLRGAQIRFESLELIDKLDD